MITIDDFKENPSDYVYAIDGMILYKESLKDFIGDYVLLLDCIQGNIGKDDKIDYENAILSYERKMKERNNSLEQAYFT